MKFPRRPALAALLCLVPFLGAAGPVLDAGLRASIFDERYKLGLGGELGALVPAGADWDWGGHLNYSHFAAQIAGTESAEEFGGYLAAYFKPRIDQVFWLRLGPHLGYAHVDGHFLDLGGDAMAVFKASPNVDWYAAVVPSLFIGPSIQSMIRIGMGVELRTGG